MKKFVLPKADDFLSDSEMLQAAVDTASSEKVGRMVIPRINPRTQKARYILDKEILLPSDIEIVLDNCYITIADGAMCNFFRNCNYMTDGFDTLMKEQENIIIRGEGHAVLDAAGHNDVFEWSSLKDGRPHVSCNNIIFLHNVRNFTVKNLEVRNQRWWALNFSYCRDGYIGDITDFVEDEFSNRDCINLRAGCRNIVIERISGCSGDDFIALSGIGKSYSYQTDVKGKKNDICDIVVKDIIGTSRHEGIVTLRCHDGRKLHNVLVENIIESNGDDENRLPYGTIMIGQNAFYSYEPGEDGAVYDITVRNVYTKSGGTAFTLGTTLHNSTFENINAENCINVFTTVNYDHEGVTKLVKREYGDNGIKLKNVKIKGVYVDKSVKGTLFDFEEMAETDYIDNLDISDVSYNGNNKIMTLSDNCKCKVTYEGMKI